MTKKIYNEIERLWIKFYNEMQLDSFSKVKGSKFVNKYAKGRKTKPEILQPWLAIFEFALDWILCLYLALCENLDGSNSIPRNKKRRVLWVLTASAYTYGTSVKNICLSGFDDPARALLRSYTDILFFSLAILDDEKLRNEYMKAKTNEEIKKVWCTELSFKKLQKRLNKIEIEFGLDANKINEFTEWRKSEYFSLSHSTHVAYVEACRSVLFPSSAEEDVIKLGILGTPLSYSFETISYAARTTWYFVQHMRPFLTSNTKENKGIFRLNRNNDLHQHIVIGAIILNKLTLKYWELVSSDG